MLWRIAYMSSAESRDFREDAPTFLAGIRRRNEVEKITGVLVFCDGSIFQVLEGDRHVVEAMFATIKNDRRHRTVSTILSGQINVRDFSDWRMAWLDVPVEHELRSQVENSIEAVTDGRVISSEIDILLSSFAKSMRAKDKTG